MDTKPKYLLLLAISCCPNLQDTGIHTYGTGYKDVVSETVAGVYSIHSNLQYSETLLDYSGTWAKSARAASIAQMYLYVHAERYWINPCTDTYVAGIYNQNVIEIGSTNSALLHEEIHLMRNDVDHTGWETSGYYGLDTYFASLSEPNEFYDCSKGRGMTKSMVTQLRANGFSVDSFLKTRPDCVNP